MKQLTTDYGKVWVTDINNWFSSLSNLNSECKNYTVSEIRYKEILAEHDKQVIEEFVNKLRKKAKILTDTESISKYCVYAVSIDEIEKEKNND